MDFRLFPPFPKTISQHFSASIFFFPLWRKHCYTERKPFPLSLTQTGALLHVCALDNAHFLHQESYCHGWELAGRTGVVVKAAPLGRLGAAWILVLSAPQSCEGF